MYQKFHKKHIQKILPEYKNITAFKTQQKNYKLYQGKQTNFTTLFTPNKQKFINIAGYQVCQLPFPSGAYYIPNFLDATQVVNIGFFALNSYWRKPYRTNLDRRNQLYQQKNTEQNKQEIEKLQDTDIKQKNQQKDKNGYDKIYSYVFNDKIRWANVGFQYDWTLRKYPQFKTPIHFTIQQLSDHANQLFNSIKNVKKCYIPESAIINYYGLKDYMTGHLDDAQLDQQSPIYSFSFGLSCVFLIGGRTKDEKPTAIKLNSGDLIIMSGQARKCYHGVPRVLQHTFFQPSKQQQSKVKQKIQKLVQKVKEQTKIPIQNSYNQIKSYLNTHRININIRQVYPKQ